MFSKEFAFQNEGQDGDHIAQTELIGNLEIPLAFGVFPHDPPAKPVCPQFDHAADLNRPNPYSFKKISTP